MVRTHGMQVSGRSFCTLKIEQRNEWYGVERREQVKGQALDRLVHAS